MLTYLVKRVCLVVPFDDGPAAARALMMALSVSTKGPVYRSAPGSIPPALLVAVTTFPFSILKGSLFSEPFFLADEKPSPNSTPLTAGIENIAFARSPSNVSKAGSPSPAGTFNAIT